MNNSSHLESALSIRNNQEYFSGKFGDQEQQYQPNDD
jgi:hypothetical protein